nr:hypothetical protein GCM10020093_048930 [Planobispora longispora]
MLPKVAARMPELKFVIAVSPAINWLRQGRYNLLAELKERGASPEETRAAVARSDETLEHLREGSTFERYRAAVGDVDGMTADRWRFITANHTSDASDDLAEMRTPVLLMLGGHDVNVDTGETEDTYRRLLTRPGQLQVRRYPDATHSMVPKDVEDSELRALVLALAAPAPWPSRGTWTTCAATWRAWRRGGERPRPADAGHSVPGRTPGAATQPEDS